MIILRLLLLLTNLHLKLLSTQGTGADKLLSTQRVNNWNSLPDHIVNAGSLNVFKNSLDRLWATQDILYNYRGVIEKNLYVI